MLRAGLIICKQLILLCIKTNVCSLGASIFLSSCPTFARVFYFIRI